MSNRIRLIRVDVTKLPDTYKTGSEYVLVEIDHGFRTKFFLDSFGRRFHIHDVHQLVRYGNNI